MKNIILSILFLFIYGFPSFAQEELNAYKYVIVPKKFEFLKSEDKYEVNSLTKFLFIRKGFNSVFEGDIYPEELMHNPCLGLKADVISSSSMFTTKLNVVLKDCYDKIVFTSIVGKSKEKEFKRGYHESLREAFVSVDELNYQYDSSLATHTSITPKQEVATVAPIVIPAVVPKAATKTEVSHPKKKTNDEKEEARFYTNGNISFLLIEQNNNLVAYINDSKDSNFKKGEKIGTLYKTSLPNVYRISWKNNSGEKMETTGYFDEEGNLKIDINKDGVIEVKVFKVEK